MIPKSWVWTTLEYVCSKIGSGSTPKGSNYSTSGIPFFRSQNVYNEGLVFDDIKYISEEIHQQMISTEVLPNDILLNITGASLGRCAVVPSNFKKGNVSQHVCILRPIVVLADYLHCYILSSFFSKEMKVTGSGREGLPKYNLEKMLLPIPPLHEQERIVAETKRWFSLIDEIDVNKENLLECVDQAKKKVLNLAIHGKLVPHNPNDEPAIELLKRINPNFVPCDTSHYEKNSFKIPEGWIWVCLEQVADIARGGSPRPIKSYLTNDKNGINWIKIGDAEKGEKYINHCEQRIKPEGVKSSRFVHRGDFLLTNSMSYGRPYILNIEGCIHDGWMVGYFSERWNL